MGTNLDLGNFENIKQLFNKLKIRKYSSIDATEAKYSHRHQEPWLDTLFGALPFGAYFAWIWLFIINWKIERLPGNLSELNKNLQ